MKQALIIKSSILGDYSQSNALIESIKPKLNNFHLIERDLAQDPVPLLDGDTLFALNSDQENAIKNLADSLLAEVKDSDLIILAAPMYNFSVPTQMKAWLDLLCRAGVTFQYTEHGPVGMLDNKPVLIITSRGGQHQGQASDLIAPYLTQILGFIGIHDLKFIYAEGLNMGSEQDKNAVLSQAVLDISAYLDGKLAIA